MATMMLSLILLSTSSFADNNCLSTPKEIKWGKGGSIHTVLCGYKSGNVNTSYIEISGIPRKTSNGCIIIHYQPHKNSDPRDSLMVAPAAGVVVDGTRRPTTLDLPDSGTETTHLPIKTDSQNKNNYSFAISGQSSSVDIEVIIKWSNDKTCGS
jgi:hypothetical protein